MFGLSMVADDWLFRSAKPVLAQFRPHGTTKTVALEG